VTRGNGPAIRGTYIATDANLTADDYRGAGRTRLSPSVARAVEKACRGVVTKEQLNPDVYLPA